MRFSFHTITRLLLLGFVFHACRGPYKTPEHIDNESIVIQNDTIYDSTFKWEKLKDVFAHHYSNKNLNGFEKILEKQTLLNVVYVGYDQKIHKGQLVCNQSVADELKSIFTELYQLKFPINSIKPISEFDFDDTRSMELNNTTCFDYRLKTRKNGLSKHAYGTAIDINPQQNPFVHHQKTLPENHNPELKTGTISFNDSIGKKVIAVFKAHGWKWGGNWANSKDYMHFEK